MPPVTPRERPDMMVFQAAQVARFMAIDYAKAGAPENVVDFLETAQAKQDTLLSENHRFNEAQRAEILNGAKILFEKAIVERKAGTTDKDLWSVVDAIATSQSPAAAIPGL